MQPVVDDAVGAANSNGEEDGPHEGEDTDFGSESDIVAQDASGPIVVARPFAGPHIAVHAGGDQATGKGRAQSR
jgi:hypothetical protein